MPNKTAEPVITSASVASAIRTVVVVLGLLGFHAQADFLSTQAVTLTSVIYGVFELVVTGMAAFHARSKVTPVDRVYELPASTVHNLTALSDRSISVSGYATATAGDDGISDVDETDPYEGDDTGGGEFHDSPVH